MAYSAYLAYLDENAKDDDNPLYIFEPRLGEKFPELLKDYDVPKYFQEDYMAYFASSDTFRPYYRWLLIGGHNSGFALHQDPCYTSAWNALILGRKRWVMRTQQCR